MKVMPSFILFIFSLDPRLVNEKMRYAVKTSSVKTEGCLAKQLREFKLYHN